MQKAVPVGVGAMAALLGLDYEAAVAVANEAAQGQVCQAANDNGGGQVVVSGDKTAVDRAVEIAKTKGAKRAMLLPVCAPFHCELMQPAADAMAQALAGVTIKAPSDRPVVLSLLTRRVALCTPDRLHRHGSSHFACYAPVTTLAQCSVASTMIDSAELLHFRMDSLAPST